MLNSEEEGTSNNNKFYPFRINLNYMNLNRKMNKTITKALNKILEQILIIRLKILIIIIKIMMI